MIELRRVFTHAEDIFHEFGPVAAVPLRRAVVAAVVANPFAGRYEPDIAPFMEQLKPLGVDLAHRVLATLGVAAEAVEGYGKAAIVGASGEIEHGALWHVPGGYAMRQVLGYRGGSAAASSNTGQHGNALAIVPSTKKVGPPGAHIDVPLTHINASYVRSHFDAIEVRVPGAPAADEIVFVLAMSTGPRIHARLGGLRADQIEHWDGQR